MDTETKRDFAADLRVCEIASRGPWVADENVANQIRQPNVSKRRRIVTPPDFDGIADAKFIAEAREGWPAALAEIERLRKSRDHFEHSALESVDEIERMRDLCERILTASMSMFASQDDMIRRIKGYAHEALYPEVYADEAQ